MSIENQDIEPQYLAGLIDGDGTLYIEVTSNKRGGFVFYPHTKIALAKEEAWLLKSIREHYGGSYRIYPEKGFAEWSLTNREINKKLLNDIMPFLKLKKRRAELVLEGIEIMNQRKPPYTLPRESVLKLMRIVEQIRKECKSHRRRLIKWTYDVVKQTIDESGFHGEERMRRHAEHLRSIGKRGIGHRFPKGIIPWNKMPREKEERIIQAYKRGVPTKEITREFHIAQSTLYKLLKRNKIQLRKYQK